jgi:hypothetical protein
MWITVVEKLIFPELVKKFPHVMEVKVYHQVYNSQPLVPLISQMNEVHAFNSFCLTSLLILYSHLHVSLPCGLIPSGFQAVDGTWRVLIVFTTVSHLSL